MNMPLEQMSVVIKNTKYYHLLNVVQWTLFPSRTLPVSCSQLSHAS